MLQMTGQVINVFTLGAGVDKDGKEYGERHKVQLLGTHGSKMDLMDLTIDDLADWSGLKGKKIVIDIGVFAPAKNSIVYYVTKGAKPRVCDGR